MLDIKPRKKNKLDYKLDLALLNMTYSYMFNELQSNIQDLVDLKVQINDIQKRITT